MAPGVYLALTATIAVAALTPGPAVTAIVARAITDGIRPALAINAGVVAMAVLEGDVAEDEVGGVVGQGQGAAVGHVAGLEMIRLAELGNRLAAPLQERGIEIAGHDLREQAGEACRHATDTAADLDYRLLGPVRTVEPEGLEVGEGLVVAGGHELGQADVIATVVEHPTRLAYHCIGRVLGLGC